MNRMFPVLTLTLLLLFSSACSENKPPTQAAVIGSTVISTLQDLSHMFEKKNLPGFMNMISDNFTDRQAFIGSLEAIFSKYDAVRFTVQYTKMLILIDEHGGTKAQFNWDSEWQTGGGGIQKDNGTVTFLFNPKDGKLLSIEGRNPFIPQPAQMPGK
jgi:hypothetical protein